MRRILMLLVLVLSVAAAMAKTPEGFATTWEQVQQTAQARHVCIYLHFTTDWCGWCRKIESETYTDARVKQELATNFAAATLDCTEKKGQTPSEALKTNMALFQKFGGTGYPFLVILAEDGATVYQTISGYLPADAFLQRLQDARKTEQDYLAFKAYAATADATSYDYAQRAMRMMARMQRKSDAVAMAKRVRELDPGNAKGDALEAAWIGLQNSPATEGKLFMDAIAQFDADNAKGYLEKATQAQSMQNLQRKQYAQCITDLERLITAAKSLQNGQDTYGMLGFAYHEIGNIDKAIANMETAIKLDPTSGRGKWLQQRVDAYKSEKK